MDWIDWLGDAWNTFSDWAGSAMTSAGEWWDDMFSGDDSWLSNIYEDGKEWLFGSDGATAGMSDEDVLFNAGKAADEGAWGAVRDAGKSLFGVGGADAGGISSVTKGLIGSIASGALQGYQADRSQEKAAAAAAANDAAAYERRLKLREVPKAGIVNNLSAANFKLKPGGM